MKKRNIIAAVVGILLIIFILWRSCPFIQSIGGSRPQPTPTGTFSGSARERLLTLQAPQANGQINREQAIGLAEFYCAEVHSEPQEAPKVLEADRMTALEASQKISMDNQSDWLRSVWLVSLDGKWTHTGGPVSVDETPRGPIIFDRCRVVIDAKTGNDFFVMSN